MNNKGVKNDCIIGGIDVGEKENAIDWSMSQVLLMMIIFSKHRKNLILKKKTVVKFSTKSHKDKLNSKPKLKETECTNNVYVNDVHSRETLNIFHYAKSLKFVGYQFIYIRNERAYCKKRNRTKPKLLNNEDVDKILLQAITSKQCKRRSLVNTREMEA